MAQSRARSRIARFKQPFLVGAVTSASLLGGCGGRTDGPGSNPDGLTGTREDCPTGQPAAGSTCARYVPGLTCEFGADTSCPRSLRCDDQEWVDVSASCNPPPPSDECPTEAPAAGAHCQDYVDELNCEYPRDNGCRTTRFCKEGSWEDQSPTCNPPPPLDECPEKVPSAGSNCSSYVLGLLCGYGADTSCPTTFVCADGEWEDQSPTCNPPPPVDECPAEVPEARTDCSSYLPGLQCEYDAETSCPTTFVCDDGLWESQTLLCNPPPVDTECPSEPVLLGASCEGYEVGLECPTDVGGGTSCPEASLLSCGPSGIWEGPVVICNPPPPPLTECPTEMPTPGESCEEYEVGLACPEASCDAAVGTVCGAGGVWEAVEVACNPPPPETDTPDAG